MSLFTLSSVFILCLIYILFIFNYSRVGLLVLLFTSLVLVSIDNVVISLGYLMIVVLFFGIVLFLLFFDKKFLVKYSFIFGLGSLFSFAFGLSGYGDRLLVLSYSMLVLGLLLEGIRAYFFK